MITKSHGLASKPKEKSVSPKTRVRPSGEKHAPPWPPQALDPQADPNRTCPIAKAATSTEAKPGSLAGGFVLPNAANVQNVFGNFNVGSTAPSQGLRPIFIYPFTDMGNAQLFYRFYGKDVHWDEERGEWLAWNGKRWLTGKSARQRMMRLVKKLLTALYLQAESRRPLRTRNEEAVTPKEALDWAKSTSQLGRQKAMLELVRDMPGVRVAKAELDSDPYLLGVANGVLDLRTGTLIENRPEL